MKIKTQFLIMLSLFALLLLVAVAALYATNRRIESLNRQAETARRIELAAVDLSFLSGDYLLYGEAPQRARWETRFADLSRDLDQLQPATPRQQALVENMQNSRRRLGAVFAEVAATLETAPRTAGGALEPERVQVSWSRTAVQGQSIIFNASLLSQQLEAQVDRLKRHNLILVSALIGVFGASLLTTYLTIYRRALGSLARLEAGTRIVGAGNLDHIIPTPRADEIGELSRAFNRMTASLREVTASKADLECVMAERERVEAALRESEARRLVAETVEGERQRLFGVLEALPAMICLLTPDYHVAFANRSFAAKFGASNGRRCYEYCYGRSGPCEFCESYDVLKTGRPHHWEVQAPDGAIIDVHDLPFTDVDGSPLILEMDIDITNFRRAETELARHREHLEELVTERTARLEALNKELQQARLAALNLMEDALAGQQELESVNAKLRESEERYRALYQQAAVGIERLDAAGRILEVNAMICQILGYSREELLGRSYLEITHPEDREDDRTVMAELWKGAVHSYVSEKRYVARDGRPVWVRITSSLARGEEGEPLYRVSIVEDITARRKAEEDLRQAARALQTLNETLEQRVRERTALAEQRAQQLRALAAELVRAEEQERRRLAGLLHDHLQQLLAAAILQLNVAQRRLAAENHALLKPAVDLLTEAIQSSRSLTAELSPAILHDAGLAPALHWLGRWVETNYNLRVTVEAPDDRDRPPIPEEMAALLFHNTRELLFNVVKHAGVDRATLALDYPTPNTVRVVVSDRGRGIDPTQERGGVGGGGFGLLSIRERLAYVGGRFEVQSAPGEGTTITMTLPLRAPGPALAPEAPLAPRDRPPAAPEARGDGQRPLGARKLRLLLADDHPIVRTGLAQLLNSEPDLEVVGEANDGLEALARARELKPDMVLMDVNMPRLDGVEATRRLLAEMPGVCVIALSMFDDAEKQALMRAAGASGYVAKGGPPAALLQTIRACRREP